MHKSYFKACVTWPHISVQLWNYLESILKREEHLKDVIASV